MTIPGIRFVDPKAPEQPLHVRADVALFAGLVKCRRSSMPDWVIQQWQALGFAKPYPSDALNLPIRLHSFAQFDAVFDPDSRAFDETPAAALVPSALGLAVRSFFAEGGICCYVVRCGNPLTLLPDKNSNVSSRTRDCVDLIQTIIPGREFQPDVPSTWCGMGHVLGLDDVSMVLLPDLPDLCAGPPSLLPDTYVPEPLPEVFKPAGAPPNATYQQAQPLQLYSAPRLDGNGQKIWTVAIARALKHLGANHGGSNRRDVQLIASLPLPASAMQHLEKSPDAYGITSFATENEGARLQLTYPWVQTAASASLPEALQGSEGVVAGMLARNALSRGAFMSASGLRCASVRDLSTKLARSNLDKPFYNGTWLGDGLTLLGRDDQGFLLLSDSNLSQESTLRAASLRRLQGIVLRAARAAGEDLIFEANVASTWTRLRHRLEDYLAELWQLGAFDGETPQDAFTVRCGPVTMTQNDIDAGRMVAEIRFISVQPIEHMIITLEFGAAQPARLRAA